MTTDLTLLGDVGGTTARFALSNGDRLGPIDHVAVADHRSLIDAIGHFLGERRRGEVGAGVIGVAGPVQSGRCIITNSHWTADAEEMRAAFGFSKVTLINDFEAVAWALQRLGPDDVEPLGGGCAVPRAPMVVIGPGTGLGMAALMSCAGRMLVIPTEGGHTTLPAATRREDAVIAHLRDRFGHVSAERALSGPGLENLYAAVAAIDGATVPNRTAAQITQYALDRRCSVCQAAVDMFCAMLGTVAGNLALMFRARGGVYIAGGIAPRLTDYLGRSAFRARFVAKGRFSTYLENIPTTIIINPDAAFLGLQSLATAAQAR